MRDVIYRYETLDTNFVDVLRIKKDNDNLLKNKKKELKKYKDVSIFQVIEIIRYYGVFLNIYSFETFCNQNKISINSRIFAENLKTHWSKEFELFNGSSKSTYYHSSSRV